MADRFSIIRGAISTGVPASFLSCWSKNAHAIRRGSSQAAISLDPDSTGQARRSCPSSRGGGDRRHRGDHALELPLRHVRAQGRRGARRGLRHGGEARGADALLCVGAGRARRTRRRAGRRHQCRHGEGPSAGWVRVRPKSARAQADLHRLDRGRKDSPAAGGREYPEMLKELGGNAPLIVFEDADLDRAVQGAPRNIALAARPASRPIASSCRLPLRTPSPKSWLRRRAN